MSKYIPKEVRLDRVDISPKGLISIALAGVVILSGYAVAQYVFGKVSAMTTQSNVSEDW